MNMTGRGSRQTEQSSLRVYRTKSLRKPKKIKYTEGTTSNWCFCRPRRSHDGVTTESRWGHATMKTNQMSNAHASYGRTTSDRPSSSLPSWILRSLTTLAFSRRINSSFNLFFNVRGMRRGGIIAGATVISTSR